MEQIKQQEEFLSSFTNKLVVFDPLDRQVTEDDDNNVVKRDKLLNLLREMPFVDGNKLGVPLSKDMAA